MLHNALALPPGEVMDAHRHAKDALIDVVVKRTGRRLSPDVVTLGFDRRATTYNRPELVLSNLPALSAIAKTRPLQSTLRAARELGDDIPVIYLTDYDLELALVLVSGVDVWLNTPLRPLEASGTSAMKAALNGVPGFRVLDGWWREGCVEGVTGWAIGGDAGSGDTARADVEDLYRKLQHVIAPLYYDGHDAWIRIMRQCIALNASFFNTDRMVRQYLLHAYSPVTSAEVTIAPTD